MGVPDTTTFTLQDVADEFSLGTNDGLTDCFDEATSADFDPAYSGDKDNLLNFRNYDGSSSSLTYPQIYKRQTGSSNIGPFKFYYAAGSSPRTVYTNAGLTTLVGQWNALGQSWQQDISNLTASQRVCGATAYDATFKTDSSSNMTNTYCGQ